MMLITLSFFLLTLSTTLTQAELEKGDPTLKNVPKRTPSKAGDTKFDIKEACKDSTSESTCESTLKSIKGGKENLKVSQFAQMVVRHAQTEYGHTTTKVRTRMREDDMEVKIKKALSHCLKMYLDMADVIRGSYLAVKSKKYGESDIIKFIRMAHSLPSHCEEGLKKAGTSGEKLGLYKNYLDLEIIASALESVIRYASPNKEGGKESTKD